MVLPDQIEATLDALFALGYSVHHLTPPDAGKWYGAERLGDVGMVDLHRQLPGPAFFYRRLGDVKQHCKMV
jgi:hypothetical protein